MHTMEFRVKEGKKPLRNESSSSSLFFFLFFIISLIYYLKKIILLQYYWTKYYSTLFQHKIVWQSDVFVIMKMPIAEFYLDSFVHFETFLRTILLTHGVSLFSATSYLPQQVRFRLCSNMPRKIDAITVQREMLEYYFVHGGYTISGIADGRNCAPHKVKRRTPSRWIQWSPT